MPVQLTQDRVFPIILETLLEQLGIQTSLSPQTALLDDLGMDSLEIVELGVALEKKLSLSFPDARFRACVTLGDIAEVVLAAEQEQGRGETA